MLAHFWYKMVHCGIFACCIVGFMTRWDTSLLIIPKVNCFQPGKCFWTLVLFTISSTALCLRTNSWWRHEMETFSALLVLCAGNSPVTGEFPTQRPVTRSFDVFFDLRLNKRLSKQSWGRWFETPSRSLWRHCYAPSRWGCQVDDGIVNVDASN